MTCYSRVITLLYIIVIGSFLDDLTLAKVFPIFKDGDRTNGGNYRPISVISAAATIWEKLISY